MALPDSYTFKPGSIPAYFDALLDAEAPERFSIKFLENLDFTSTNDRLLIGVLKDLGFLNTDGTPQQRYFEFLDRSRSKQVLAKAIREAYAHLFAVNKNAHQLPAEEVRNKLRTLYAGKKSDQLIGRIAATFSALCEYADFSKQEQQTPRPSVSVGSDDKKAIVKHETPLLETVTRRNTGNVLLDSLQYHINIVLPESRDQAVYDAIFKSLKEHLGQNRG